MPLRVFTSQVPSLEGLSGEAATAWADSCFMTMLLSRRFLAPGGSGARELQAEPALERAHGIISHEVEAHLVVGVFTEAHAAARVVLVRTGGGEHVAVADREV